MAERIIRRKGVIMRSSLIFIFLFLLCGWYQANAQQSPHFYLLELSQGQTTFVLPVLFFKEDASLLQFAPTRRKGVEPGEIERRWYSVYDVRIQDIIMVNPLNCNRFFKKNLQEVKELCEIRDGAAPTCKDIISYPEKCAVWKKDNFWRLQELDSPAKPAFSFSERHCLETVFQPGKIIDKEQTPTGKEWKISGNIDSLFEGKPVCFYTEDHLQEVIVYCQPEGDPIKHIAWTLPSMPRKTMVAIQAGKLSFLKEWLASSLPQFVEKLSTYHGLEFKPVKKMVFQRWKALCPNPEALDAQIPELPYLSFYQSRRSVSEEISCYDNIKKVLSAFPNPGQNDVASLSGYIAFLKNFYDLPSFVNAPETKQISCLLDKQHSSEKVAEYIGKKHNVQERILDTILQHNFPDKIATWQPLNKEAKCVFIANEAGINPDWNEIVRFFFGTWKKALQDSAPDMVAVISNPWDWENEFRQYLPARTDWSVLSKQYLLDKCVKAVYGDNPIQNQQSYNEKLDAVCNFLGINPPDLDEAINMLGIPKKITPMEITNKAFPDPFLQFLEIHKKEFLQYLFQKLFGQCWQSIWDEVLAVPVPIWFKAKEISKENSNSLPEMGEAICKQQNNQVKDMRESRPSLFRIQIASQSKLYEMPVVIALENGKKVLIQIGKAREFHADLFLKERLWYELYDLRLEQIPILNRKNFTQETGLNFRESIIDRLKDQEEPEMKDSFQIQYSSSLYYLSVEGNSFVLQPHNHEQAYVFQDYHSLCQLFGSEKFETKQATAKTRYHIPGNPKITIDSGEILLCYPDRPCFQEAILYTPDTVLCLPIKTCQQAAETLNDGFCSPCNILVFQPLPQGAYLRLRSLSDHLKEQDNAWKTYKLWNINQLQDFKGNARQLQYLMLK